MNPKMNRADDGAEQSRPVCDEAEAVPSKIQLSDRDFDAFCVALRAEFRPNEALRRALEDVYKRFSDV